MIDKLNLIRDAYNEYSKYSNSTILVCEVWSDETRSYIGNDETLLPEYINFCEYNSHWILLSDLHDFREPITFKWNLKQNFIEYSYKIIESQFLSEIYDNNKNLLINGNYEGASIIQGIPHMTSPLSIPGVSMVKISPWYTEATTGRHVHDIGYDLRQQKIKISSEIIKFIERRIKDKIPSNFNSTSWEIQKIPYKNECTALIRYYREEIISISGCFQMDF